MPRLQASVLRDLKTTSRHPSLHLPPRFPSPTPPGNFLSTAPTPPVPSQDPLELVYTLSTSTFRFAPRSTLLRNKPSTPSNGRSKPAPALLELYANDPPLLVDGRMQIVAVPRWRRQLRFLWRASEGREGTRVKERVVLLGWRVWWERNFCAGAWRLWEREDGPEGDGEGVGRWKDLWIER